MEPFVGLHFVSLFIFSFLLLDQLKGLAGGF